MGFSGENLGVPISERLSSYLRAYTDKYDRANVSRLHNIGTSTIRDVVFRANTLTEYNSQAIEELIKIAISNCDRSIFEAKETKKRLLQILK